jgi:hypothetical protein
MSARTITVKSIVIVVSLLLDGINYEACGEYGGLQRKRLHNVHESVWIPSTD